MSATDPTKVTNIAAWILQILLAIVFAAAGAAKLAGVPMMIETFEFVGLGQWFRYVTAAVEIIGAVALVFPGFAVLGSILLAATMVGAIVAHLTVIPTSFVPALVLLVLLVVVFWLRRGQLQTLRARFLGAAAFKPGSSQSR